MRHNLVVILLVISILGSFLVTAKTLRRRRPKSSTKESNLVVETSTGPVQGVLGKLSNLEKKGLEDLPRWVEMAANEYQEFRGIPFAKPPIGELRFKNPQPVEPWTNILKATEYSSPCYGTVDETFPGLRGSSLWNSAGNMSEDCLYLNVWAPKNVLEDPTKQRPVMVWIYGGGYFSGSDSLLYDLYNGHWLASIGDVILVTFNYRLLSFGFLTVEGGDSNVGLRDQLAALQWVNDNIAAFGGNPDKVTLFGESAGAASAGMLALCPYAQNLFSRIILQSSSPSSPWAISSNEKIESQAQLLAAKLNCPIPATGESWSETLDCLREVPVADLYAADVDIVWAPYSDPSRDLYLQVAFTPTVDSEMVLSPLETQEQLVTMITTTGLNNKEVLIGSNRNEGSYWLIYFSPDLFSKDTKSLLTYDQFHSAIPATTFLTNATALNLIEYVYRDWSQPTSGKAFRDSIDRLVSDTVFVCSVLDFADAHSIASGGDKTFVYKFNGMEDHPYWPDWMGVIRGGEIQWIFGDLLKPQKRDNDETIYQSQPVLSLSLEMMRRWVHFAKTGVPEESHSNQQTWLPWTTDKKQRLHFDVARESWQQQSHMELARDDTGRCQLWKSMVTLI